MTGYELSWKSVQAAETAREPEGPSLLDELRKTRAANKPKEVRHTSRSRSSRLVNQKMDTKTKSTD